MFDGSKKNRLYFIVYINKNKKKLLKSTKNSKKNCKKSFY